MLTSPLNTRRWPRHHVDLPVRIIILNGLNASAVPGHGTAISRCGMALRSTLALKPGDLMQVQFPTSNPFGVTAVVRSRKDDCFGLEFLAQLSYGNRTMSQSKFVDRAAGGGRAEAQGVRGHSCSPKALLAGLRRKQLEIKQVHIEIQALKLAMLLLAED